jgi:hypothetical protein
MEPSPHFEEMLRQAREVGWMAASQALGYEARREGTKADVALWFWVAAAWLEQHKEGQ